MSRLLTLARRFTSRGAVLRHARSGSINILFGLAFLPLVGLVGYGIDYGVAITAKAKLDQAADAAALAAAKAYVGANANQANVSQNVLTAGTNQGINAFTVNAGKVAFTTVTLATPVVTRTGQTITSTVSYTATVQNNFGKIFRTPVRREGQPVRLAEVGHAPY